MSLRVNQELNYEVEVKLNLTVKEMGTWLDALGKERFEGLIQGYIQNGLQEFIADNLESDISGEDTFECSGWNNEPCDWIYWEKTVSNIKVTKV